MGNITFSYLNINSKRNKFENLCELVSGDADIFFYCEHKTEPFVPGSAILDTWFLEASKNGC